MQVIRKTDNVGDPIKMVEDSIKKSGNYPTETQLWRSLRKKIHYSTLKRILRQLQRENKILYDKGSIVWIFVDTPEARQSLKHSTLLR